MFEVKRSIICKKQNKKAITSSPQFLHQLAALYLILVYFC